MHYPLTAARRLTALDLLRPLAGQRPRIVAEEPAGHEWAPVTRLTFDREIPGAGRTVMVKTRRVDGEGHGGPPHLRREQAGLRTARDTGVTPRLIAADDRAGVVIAADLGRWPTLESVLTGPDGGAARQAMIEAGRAIGRLHAATLPLERFHGEALAGCGGGDARDFRLGHWPGAERWPEIEEMFAEHGFPSAAAARPGAAFVVRRLTEPSPFAALVHMDLNPTNVLLTPGGAKLVDFESSVFGHTGFDACFLHYPFPTYSAHCAVLPDDVAAQADRAYRDELGRVLPPDVLTGYDEMLAVGAAALLAIRLHRLPKLVSEDQPPGERWRRRAQLAHQLRVFGKLAERAGCLPDLAGWSARLADAMASRWVEAATPPPVYPAFSDAAVLSASAGPSGPGSGPARATG